MNLKKVAKQFVNKSDLLTNLVVIIVLAASILPFIYYGENSIVTVHDNLDISVANYKMLKDNNLFFKFDASSPILNGLSIIYFAVTSFNIKSLLNIMFDTFTAYIISYVMNIIIGYFSMKLLLKYIFKDIKSNNLCKLVAVAFAILPLVPDWQFGISTLPLIIYIFLKIFNSKNNIFRWKTLLLILFPLFSNFTAQGIFVLGLWFIGIVYYSIKNKRINMNLLFGFIFLVIGYVLVDIRLFYSMFIMKEPLNRSIFSIPASPLLGAIKVYLIEGYYHATTFQKCIILPVFIIGLPFINYKYRGSKTIKYLNISTILIVLFSIIAGLYDAELFSKIIKVLIPPLDGFNWGRIVFFNRVLWYIVFCGILIGVYKFNKIKYLAYGIALMQIGYIFICPTYYNDAIKNIFHNYYIQKDSITYSEFYSEELFSQIKKDIDYNGEGVAAYGYHPAVLIYNGFNTVDAYMNSYPIEYMKKFRGLIAPELEINERDRKYFDMWGGRLYLYSLEMSYEPTRVKVDKSVTLNIDMDVFAELKGKYILSSAEIENSDKLGMKLFKVYDDNEGIYRIYVYKIQDKL